MIDDSDGDLWIATLDGVMRFSLHGLVSYGRGDGLKDQEVDSIQEDHAGVLQVVSPGWFVSELKDRKFTSIHPNLPDASRLWTSPLGFLDHTGQWWFLTGRGLYRFPRVGRTEDLARVSPVRYTNLDGLPAQWVYCMFEDSVAAPTPSPHPAHRTGRAHFAHPALGERFTPSPTESCRSAR